MIGLPRTPYAKLNIHVGAAYGNKLWLDTSAATLNVPEKTHTPYAENDDKASLLHQGAA